MDGGPRRVVPACVLCGIVRCCIKLSLCRTLLPSSQLTEIARYTTASTPFGQLTVLSSSMVAMSMENPAAIEIWDWRAGTHVRTLTGFGGDWVLGHALLPDGRFVACDHAGTITVGSLDNWAEATAVSTDSRFVGVLAGDDGSFVTVDKAGGIKQWRNGACEVALTGAYVYNQGDRRTYFGLPLAIVGHRLVFPGTARSVALIE